ncbi:MAG: YggS family pyridoxal phosphate-dependent enzyme [Clostridia bacterium]
MMEKSYDYIKENFKRLEENVQNAAIRSGRDPKEIKILAATKTVSPDKINFAIENGLNLIGENRVQELCDKYENINLKNCDCHFIGSLQTNKIKYLVDKVSLIHSIDNMRQIKELSRLLELKKKNMDVLIEVNIGDENSKSGVKKENLYEFIDQAREFSNIKIKGLMCIPPICESKTKKIGYFSQISQYYVDIMQKKLDNIYINVLSVGMSDDYEEAIECGSTMIRVGSALFGNRIYK